MNARTVKLFMVALMMLAPTTLRADFFLFGNSQTQVVSLITNQGTFLTSTAPFDPGTNNSGFWSPSLQNITTNDNYFVGTTSSGGITFDHNDFFTFLIPSTLGNVTSASLSIPRGENTGSLPVTFTLFDVSTPAPTLNANTGASVTIFDDLGSGVSYGSIVVTNATTPDPLGIALDASAITAINSSRGNFFSIGGTLDPVPEPSSFVTLSVALAALAFVVRLQLAKGVEAPRSMH